MAGTVKDGKIGVWLAAMLVAGNMMGSSVYLLPTVLAKSGGISVLGWAAATAGALLLSAMYAGFADHGLNEAGQAGLVGRIADGIGPFFGYQAAMLYSVSCWVGNVAIALAVTGYAASFFPGVASGLMGLAVTIGAIFAMTAVNIYGAGLVSRVQTATLAIGLAPVILIAVGGWLVFRPSLFISYWNVDHAPVTKVLADTVLPIFWAFLGLESAAMCCARLRDPKRNLAAATLLGVGLAGVVYAAACVVLMGLIPAPQIAASTAPFADAAHTVFGVGIGAVVALCAMTRASGTLAGWILVSAETAQSAAASGLIPQALAEPGDRATSRTLLLVCGLTVAIALMSAAPALAEQFTLLIDVAVVLTLVMYTLSAVALWRLSAGSEPGRGLWLRTTAVLSSIFCLWVLANSGTKLLTVAAVVAVVGGFGYRFARRPAKA